MVTLRGRPFTWLASEQPEREWGEGRPQSWRGRWKLTTSWANTRTLLRRVTYRGVSTKQPVQADNPWGIACRQQRLNRCATTGPRSTIAAVDRAAEFAGLRSVCCQQGSRFDFPRYGSGNLGGICRRRMSSPVPGGRWIESLKSAAQQVTKMMQRHAAFPPE